MAAGLTLLVTALADAHPAALAPLRGGGGGAHRVAPAHLRGPAAATAATARGALLARGFGGRQGPRAFGGAITTVAAEAHPPMTRPSSEAALRAGSIREDVARYNEERATLRGDSRDADAARSSFPPGIGSPYRN